MKLNNDLICSVSGHHKIRNLSHPPVANKHSTKESIYSALLMFLTDSLDILQDKPEETPASTLRALWFAASGQHKSAQNALYGELPTLNREQIKLLHLYIRRRVEKEPLAHITGRQQFMGLELLAGSEALVPRKETELLGITANKYIKSIPAYQDKINIIDVCTGAGNLAISYAANESRAMVYASDLCPNAVSLAQKNVAHHNLEEQVILLEGDLLSPFDSPEYYNKIDLLTCNPPYISSGKVEYMDAEISSHEPRLAFDGGPFGIKLLYRLINEAPRFLTNGGHLMFEVGLGQGETIFKFIHKMDSYKDVKTVLDNKGEIRAIVACV